MIDLPDTLVKHQHVQMGQWLGSLALLTISF